MAALTVIAVAAGALVALILYARRASRRRVEQAEFNAMLIAPTAAGDRIEEYHNPELHDREFVTVAEIKKRLERERQTQRERRIRTRRSWWEVNHDDHVGRTA